MDKGQILSHQKVVPHSMQEMQSIPMIVRKFLEHYSSFNKLVFINIEKGTIAPFSLPSDSQHWPFQKNLVRSGCYDKNTIGWVASK